MSPHHRERAICAWLWLVAAGAGVWAAQKPDPLGPSPVTVPQNDSMTGFIAGTVVDAATGKGVSGVVVQLGGMSARGGGRGGVVPAPVITDGQGRFYFSRLASGAFTFNAQKPGWTTISPAVTQRTTDLAVGERATDVRIQLVKLATLSGTVRDDGGDPVVGTTVIAFGRSLQSGRAVLAPASQAVTDDRGAYRITNLRPESYLVCACQRDVMPLDGTVLTTLASAPVPLLALANRAARLGADAATLDDGLRTFAPSLFPNNTSVVRAERVPLASGEERAGIDIVTPAVRAVRISGRVIGADGPVNAAAFSLASVGDGDDTTALWSIPPMVVQPDGRFDFANVPSGRYVLRVAWGPNVTSGPTGMALAFVGNRANASPNQGEFGPGAPRKVAVVPMVVGDRDITDLTVSLRDFPVISGRLKMAGDGPLPPASELTRMLMVASPTLVTPGSNNISAIGQMNADGTFRLPIAPGRYRLFVTQGPTAQSILSIDINGTDVLDQSVDITTDIGDVVVTGSTMLDGSVRGTVTGSGGTDGLTVLLFPADRRFWSDLGAASRRFRSAVASRAGAFTMAGLPDGEYLLVTVPDMQAADWLDPERLELWSRLATRITLAPGERKTVEVKR